jgi:HEAT repeat protein
VETFREIVSNLKHNQRHVRYQAVYALAQHRSEQAAHYMADVLRSDPDFEIRALASKLLMKMDTLVAKPVLLAQWDVEPKPIVRRAIIESFWSYRLSLSADDLAVLCNGLDDTNDLVRDATLQLLQVREAKTYLPQVIGCLLGDEKPRVRRRALKVIDQWHVPEAFDAVLEALQADSDDRVRRLAVTVLASLDVLGAIPMLRAAVQTETSPVVRIELISALSDMYELAAYDDIIYGLLTALDDPNKEVWHAAAEALWYHGEDMFSVVLDALHSENRQLRRVALKGILWLSTEFDDDIAPEQSWSLTRNNWSWWN